MKFCILGAGKIGLYLAARIAFKNQDLSIDLIGSSSFKEKFESYPLSFRSLAQQTTVQVDNQGDQIRFIDYKQLKGSQPEADSKYDLVLVTVKTHQTADALNSIQTSIQPSTNIIVLQNGVESHTSIASQSESNNIYEGLVTFNVVLNEKLILQQSSTGPIVLPATVPTHIQQIFKDSFDEVLTTQNIQGYRWSKLLLNLNNPINALSGLPILKQIEKRKYRILLSNAMQEGIAISRKKGIKLEKLTPVSPYVIPYILKLPTPLYKIVAKKNLKIDKDAKSSMLLDLLENKKTEIGSLSGRIAQEGKKLGIPTPVNSRLVQNVLEAEKSKKGSPNHSPEELMT